MFLAEKNYYHYSLLETLDKEVSVRPPLGVRPWSGHRGDECKHEIHLVPNYTTDMPKMGACLTVGAPPPLSNVKGYAKVWASGKRGEGLKETTSGLGEGGGGVGSTDWIPNLHSSIRWSSQTRPDCAPTINQRSIEQP